MNVRTRQFVTGLAAAALGLSLLASTALAGHPGFPSDRGIQPVSMPGNPKCADVAPGSRELSVEPVEPGRYTDGTLEVRLTRVAEKRFFDWSSNMGVDVVIVKGGPNANVYRYAPEANGDGNLHAPINDANGAPYGLSHVAFCYDVEQTPPPPPPPPQATRCTGHAYDVRLDLAGPASGFVGPAIATEHGEFPDEDALSAVSLTVPGASRPAVSATTLRAENRGAPASGCLTQITYENLVVDLRNLGTGPGIPLTLAATALQTTAQTGPNGSSSSVTLLALKVNGVDFVVSAQPNTPALDLATLGVPGLTGTVVVHEQSMTAGGVSANAIRVRASFTDPVLGVTQAADLTVAHAHTAIEQSPPPPPKERCTGRAYDVRLDLNGAVNGFVGPAAATSFDVFPDADTLSVLSLTVPGATRPAVTAQTLSAENSGDNASGCRTSIVYENLNVDLRQHGIPLTLGATAVQTTAQSGPDGSSSNVVLAGLTVNGVALLVSPEPNTTVLDLATLGISGLTGRVVLHEQRRTPGGIDANAIRVQASFTDPVLGRTQGADLTVGHAEAGLSGS
jgi:hypothetical protein